MHFFGEAPLIRKQHIMADGLHSRPYFQIYIINRPVVAGADALKTFFFHKKGMAVNQCRGTILTAVHYLAIDTW